VVVVTICHATNLIDGLDGLAAGVSGIAALSLIAGIGATGLILTLGAGLLGGILGFLPWNWHPARTFMGDVGSLFLGYTLAALVARGLGETDGWSRLVGSLLTLGVPLGDVGLTLIRRTAYRRPLFSPDRYHFYNILMIQGLSHRQTVTLACVVGGLFGGLGIVVSRFSPVGATGAVVAVAAACLLAAWRLGFLADWQRIAGTGERLA
jgi:UDP-GlcNAc:undecaprenyl-phosphate GlcNAc-1-phosphate transferase